MLLTIPTVIGIYANPAPSPTPKTIITVHSSRLCAALRDNIAPTVKGILLNDRLSLAGGGLLQKIRNDAAADRGSEMPTSGAASSLTMDDVRLTSLAHAIAKNIDKLETLLSDRNHFPIETTTPDDEELSLIRVRLEAVVADEQKQLNIIYGVADTNALQDLESRGDPIDPHSYSGSGSPIVNDPEALQVEQQATTADEDAAAAAVQPIIAACKQ